MYVCMNTTKLQQFVAATDYEINYRFGDFTTSPSANYTNYKKTMLSQGELRDADVNFDTYRILQ